MAKTLKIILGVFGGLIALLVVATLALFLFVDAGAYKPQLEAIGSRALGMDVHVEGQVDMGLFKGLNFTLENVRVVNRDSEVAAIAEVRAGIEILPLLKNEVRLRKVALIQPRIHIERDVDGVFNFEKTKTDKPDRIEQVLEFSNVSLANASLHFTDRHSGLEFAAKDCSLELDHLRRATGQRADLLKNLSLTAELACGEFSANDVTATDLTLSVQGQDGIFDVDPIRMDLFGAQGSGSLHGDFAGEDPLYSVRYSLPQFQIEEFFKTLSAEQAAEGLLDFSANLSMQGNTLPQLKQTAEGKILLEGENLTLTGIDLDGVFSRFESSQNFNLIDVGAFFFAGPLGLAVTKGYNFAKIFQGSGGRTDIQTVISEWQIQGGVANAADVAMATNENRVALQGELDFVNNQFNDVIIALIDGQGCAMVQQRIHGSFREPVVDQPSFLKTLAGPAIELFEKARSLFPGGECEVFYTGSVAAPN
ncbi:AsmA protein [Geoalkalibacter ferrihydriticus]|uniref:AsmA domain-containing protein n=2 Tax=Geoalkalibacter ferrihydriticus TaxID=392333 RepID=A0A0C2EED7_9BACT|nr:AsmA family protein [Geoalkalibacter ferrihydriticus]KIH76993.1 hypothetical protein GFER_07965 [Geoalkalibacter ferrihydriticus DSM 17813]SDL40420.1 AsmA protein [Geoalkalibacter ferrihydriticus]